MAMNRAKNFAALSTIHTVSKPAAENIGVLTVKFGESSITVPEQVSEPVVNPAVLNFLPEKSRVFVERCPTSFALNFELNPDKIMTLTYPTREDMSAWSNDMEVERKIVSEKIKSDLAQISLALDLEGRWNRAIDPTSGQPINGQTLPEPIIESDIRLDQLENISVEDLGCCTVLSHSEFGTRCVTGFLFFK